MGRLGYSLSCGLLDMRNIALILRVETNLQNGPTMMGSFLKWFQAVYQQMTFNFELQTPVDWDVGIVISKTQSKGPES